MNTTDPVQDESELMLPSQDFNYFLDQMMYRAFDVVKDEKPTHITPTLTMYRRGDYDSDYSIASRQIPPIQSTEQIAVMETLGQSAATDFNDGSVAVCVFLITMGVKQPPKIGESLTEKEVADNATEVLLISGASLDGRTCQSIYTVQRNEDQRIVALDLHMYIPSREQYTEKSTMSNPLLAAFYNGYVTKYTEVKKGKGNSNGDILLPD